MSVLGWQLSRPVRGRQLAAYRGRRARAAGSDWRAHAWRHSRHPGGAILQRSKSGTASACGRALPSARHRAALSLSSSLSLSHKHTHTHALSLARSLSLSHARTLSLSHARARALSLCHTHTHTHTRTHAHAHTHTKYTHKKRTHQSSGPHRFMSCHVSYMMYPLINAWFRFRV